MRVRGKILHWRLCRQNFPRTRTLDPARRPFLEKNPSWRGDVIEQLAHYTMRYQESYLHLGLYSSLTSANILNLNLLTLLLYSILTLT